MNPVNGQEMSRRDFEEALSRVIAGESLAGIGTDPVGVALRAVADSAPDSEARADAIDVARLVFIELDSSTDDGIRWNGPACPSCGTEMNAEILTTSKGLKGRERCPQCDLVLVIPDLFAS